jgi:predicted phage terminase large subunit-like protein
MCYTSPVYAPLKRCIIVSVRRISRKQNKVYDIQVEGNHNFFAEGILTHNCIIADDLIKNEEEARSEAIIRMIREWWSTTLYTRLMPGGKIIVVQTRWREDDIIGYIKEIEKNDPTGKKWTELKLPAINDKGEALWPERYPISTLLNIKGTLGAANFSSLYQQEPMMIEGAMVKREWIKYYDVLPEAFNRYVISCDMAFKESSDSDFVVFQVWAARGAEYYLIDQIRDRMDFPTTLTAFKMFCSQYKKAHAKLIEVKANGQAIVDSCKKTISGIIEINPKESKESRFAACTPMFEAGNIYLPKNKSFTYDYVEEICGFPRTKHDDMVDATSQALNWMRKNTGSYYGLGIIER